MARPPLSHKSLGCGRPVPMAAVDAVYGQVPTTRPLALSCLRAWPAENSRDQSFETSPKYGSELIGAQTLQVTMDIRLLRGPRRICIHLSGHALKDHSHHLTFCVP